MPTDATLPQGRWSFDAGVTHVFEDMLQRSIPDYPTMRQLCFELACPFVQPDTAIVDLGCSRGEALAPFVERFGAQNRYVGVEVSEPMLAAARERFADQPQVAVRSLDLRHAYPPEAASVTLCILTAQFVPLEHRPRLFRAMAQHTVPGGVVVVVEKVLGATADLDTLLVERYLRLKAEHGYSQEQIERKRLSLEGVLVPVTARWNEDLLQQAGLRQVDCFWRRLNFAGWIALRDG